MLNIPIIKFSVDWWSTLHQNTTVKILSKSSIHNHQIFYIIEGNFENYKNNYTRINTETLYSAILTCFKAAA